MQNATIKGRLRRQSPIQKDDKDDKEVIEAQQILKNDIEREIVGEIRFQKKRGVGGDERIIIPKKKKTRVFKRYSRVNILCEEYKKILLKKYNLTDRYALIRKDNSAYWIIAIPPHNFLQETYQ